MLGKHEGREGGEEGGEGGDSEKFCGGWGYRGSEQGLRGEAGGIIRASKLICVIL